MRLNKKQISSIKNLALKLFNSNDVYLFGSRVDDTLKGGDIDLYIQTRKKEDILMSKIVFLREFEKEFGEQKVDLIVDNGSIKKKIFDIAIENGVKL